MREKLWEAVKANRVTTWMVGSTLVWSRVALCLTYPLFMILVLGCVVLYIAS
jgi:hypothetical protein